MSREYLIVLFVVSLLATLVSLRTTFLAWFMPDKLRKEIDGRSKILTDAYPATSFWRNASINKTRLIVSVGFVFIVSLDFLLYQSLFGG